MLKKWVTAEWMLLCLNPSCGGNIYDRWQRPLQAAPWIWLAGTILGAIAAALAITPVME